MENAMFTDSTEKYNAWTLSPGKEWMCICEHSCAMDFNAWSMSLQNALHVFMHFFWACQLNLLVSQCIFLCLRYCIYFIPCFCLYTREKFGMVAALKWIRERWHHEPLANYSTYLCREMLKINSYIYISLYNKFNMQAGCHIT